MEFRIVWVCKKGYITVKSNNLIQIKYLTLTWNSNKNNKNQGAIQYWFIVSGNDRHDHAQKDSVAHA